MRQQKSFPVHSTGELARRLGVSRWTVSRALNGHGDIGRRTAERIRAEADRLGFAPSPIGRTLRSGRSDWVGVTIPDPETFFLAGKLARLEELLAGEGWRMLIQVAEDAAAEREALLRFASMRCGGVVTVASRTGREFFSQLGGRSLPVVAVDPLEATGVDEVRTDRRAGMLAVVSHLHALGTRSLLGAEMSPEGTGYASQRLAALRFAARRFGWPDGAVGHWMSDQGTDMAAGAVLARERAAWKRAGAVVALNDRVAFGFLQALGPRVPPGLRVVGYDNSELALYARPALTTVDPRPEELMARTSQMMLERMAGLRDSGPRTSIVRPRLIVREST